MDRHRRRRVFIVGAIFFSGFFLGLVAGHGYGGHGGHGGHHRGGSETSMHRQGAPPMFRGPMMHPGFTFPGGPGGFPGGGPGGGPGIQGPQAPERAAPTLGRTDARPASRRTTPQTRTPRHPPAEGCAVCGCRPGIVEGIVMSRRALTGCPQEPGTAPTTRRSNDGPEKIATTDGGAPVPSVEHSLTVGPDGPLLLQDHYLIEQMANFNRERIPERQPHAKGGGAFGHFEVTNDVSQYTKAAVFQPGTKTEMVARFSTVAGERGSPDTWRDPRGFALKFYTSEGNFDMVGNNTPVFFMRDPMKFQNFIRSQKRMAANNLRDHNMQWDFWTLVARVGASGHLSDGRPRHPEDLAAHERLLQPHLQLDQRRRANCSG